MNDNIEPRNGDVSHADLISAIGHELRNIVGPILHQIELMEELDLDGPLLARSRRTVVESAAELHRFIDGLADLERLERNERTPELAVLDLDALLDDALLDGGDRDHVRCRSGERAGRVTADPVSVRRVIGILTAECEATSDAVVVAVRRTQDVVEVTFGGPEGAAHEPDRPVTVDDGLAVWVASLLAAASGAEVRTHSSHGSFRLRLAATPA